MKHKEKTKDTGSFPIVKFSEKGLQHQYNKSSGRELSSFILTEIYPIINYRRFP